MDSGKARRGAAAAFLARVFPGAGADLRSAVAMCDEQLSAVLVRRTEGEAQTAAPLSSLGELVGGGGKLLGVLVARRAPICDSVDAHIAMRSKRHPSCPDVHVSYIGVARGHRRRGMGRALLACAVQLCRAGGAARVWLDTRTADRLGLLYASAGFTQVATVPGLYGGGKWGEAHIYARATTGAPEAAAGGKQPRQRRR